MAVIDKLLRESTLSAANSTGRPSLLAFTQATNKRIFKDLVAEQPTTQPVTALYGIRVLNPDDKMTFYGGATFAGKMNKEERKKVPALDTSASINKGDLFMFEDVVFKALTDSPFAGTTETETDDIMNEAIAASTVRMVSEGAATDQFESGEPDISEAGFRIDKWQATVKSRKLKTTLSVELAQDLEANGFDAPDFIENILATQMAEEINKDVLQSLITVSNRYKVVGVSSKGILDLTKISGGAQEQSRTLYSYICEMVASVQRNTSFSPTYVVASSRCCAILAASGWVKKGDDAKGAPDSSFGMLNIGLPIYCDVNSPCDYVITGVNVDMGEGQVVSSLFYAPYVEGLEDVEDTGDASVGEFKVIVDPESLQPTIALLARYALTANPYTVAKDEEEARIIDGSDMDTLAGQSKLSSYLGVKLPPLEK
ncbi:capsid vertex protein [Erwinia phage FBB1]|nr:capsid vertex protein [Erwinia phage FBB1]